MGFLGVVGVAGEKGKRVRQTNTSLVELFTNVYVLFFFSPANPSPSQGSAGPPGVAGERGPNVSILHTHPKTCIL